VIFFSVLPRDKQKGRPCGVALFRFGSHDTSRIRHLPFSFAVAASVIALGL